MIKKAAVIIFIVGLTLAVFANTLSGEFVFDDPDFVVENPGIKTLDNFGGFFFDLGRTTPSDILRYHVWRPLTTISFAINYRLAGLNVLPWHAVNIALHALCAVFVFFLAYRALGNELMAALAAAFFAVHPAQAESVALIASRSNLLALAFLLPSLLLALKASETTSSAGRLRLIATSLLLFSAALLSKESAIVLPVLIFISIILIPGQKARAHRIAELVVPFAILAGLYVLARWEIIGRVAQTGMHGGSLASHLLTIVQSSAVYLKLAIFPLHMTVSHAQPANEVLFGWRSLAASAALSAVFFGAIRLRKISTVYTYGQAWFYISLLPVLNIVPINAFVSDRFLYAPLIGLALFTVRGMNDLFGERRRAAIALLLLIIAVTSVRTALRNRDFLNETSLWSAEISINPRNAKALYNIGAIYQNRGELDYAAKHYGLASRSGTAVGLLARVRLAEIALAKNDMAAALKIADDAIGVFPNFPQGYLCRAKIRLAAGDPAAAEADLKTALAVAPSSARVWDELAEFYEGTGRPGPAQESRAKARELLKTHGESLK